MSVNPNPRGDSKIRSGKRRGWMRDELKKSTTLGRIQKAIEQIDEREQNKPGQTEGIMRALRCMGFKQDIIEEAYEHFLEEKGQLELKVGTPLRLDHECRISRTLDSRLLGTEPIAVNGTFVEGWQRKMINKKLASVEFPFMLRVRRESGSLPPNELPLTKEAVKERTLLTLEKQRENMFNNLVVLMHDQSAANRKDPTMKLLSKNSRKAINSLHWVNKNMKVQVKVDQNDKRSNREIYSELVSIRNGLGELPEYTKRMFDLITNSWEQDRKSQMFIIAAVIVDSQLANNYEINVDVALIIASYCTPYGMPAPKIPEMNLDWLDKGFCSVNGSDESEKRLSSSDEKAYLARGKVMSCPTSSEVESKSEEENAVLEKSITLPLETRRLSMFSRFRSGKLLIGLRSRRRSK